MGPCSSLETQKNWRGGGRGQNCEFCYNLRLKNNGFIVHAIFYVLVCLERDSMSQSCMFSFTTMDAAQNKMGQFS